MAPHSSPADLPCPHTRSVRLGAPPASPESSNPGWLQCGFSGVALAAALRLALLLWLTHFLVTMGMDWTAGSPHAAYVAHLGVQFLLLVTACFLFTVVRVASARMYWILGAQYLAGATALNYNGDANGAAVPVPWMVINLLSAMLLTIAMAACAYLPRRSMSWLALGVSILGLVLCIQQVRQPDAADAGAVMFRHFCVLLLLVVLQLVTRRGRIEFLGTDNSTQTGNRWNKRTAAAIRQERRRIAQDLHDGVASQLVGVLSTLDPHAPEQQVLGVALEQCLLDIKLTVDGIESGDQNIVEALGSLRYRVQRPFDRLGIHLIWDVEICIALETVRGEEARQILRIAQECLSNVMRHAKGSWVLVSCRYETQTGCMEFEVRDNGAGIAQDMCPEALGKGLENMRLRARSIGAELVISSEFGNGTRVQLSLPLDPELCALPVGPGSV
jgi:signal transduction histidine kinase